MPNFKKILVIQTAFIGDVILATALLEKIHDHFPQAEIDFLLRKGNEGLLKNHPFVRQVLVWDKKSSKYKGLVQLVKKIRQERYDLVLNLQRFASMGFLTVVSGASQRVGFAKNPFATFFTHQIPHEIQAGIHEVERNAKLLSPFTDEKAFKPKLYVELGNIPAQSPYICIAPTSVWFTKQFPPEQWIRFIKAIPSHYTVYLLGGKEDAAVIEMIMMQAANPKTENLAGKLSLLASAALMKSAVLNYVNDSAPMHLCSAVNAPVCAIFCSTIPDFGFGPLSDFSITIETPTYLACRPCGLHGKKTCPQGHFKCGNDIPTQALLDALTKAEQRAGIKN